MIGYAQNFCYPNWKEWLEMFILKDILDPLQKAFSSTDLGRERGHWGGDGNAQNTQVPCPGCLGFSKNTVDCPLLYGYGSIYWTNHRVLWRQMENRVRVHQGNQAGHWQQQKPNPQCIRGDQPHQLFHDGRHYYLDLCLSTRKHPLNVGIKSRGVTVSPSQILRHIIAKVALSDDFNLVSNKKQKLPRKSFVDALLRMVGWLPVAMRLL